MDERGAVKKNLKTDGVDIDIIARASGLSKEDIQKL